MDDAKLKLDMSRKTFNCYQTLLASCTAIPYIHAYVGTVSLCEGKVEKLPPGQIRPNQTFNKFRILKSDNLRS